MSARRKTCCCGCVDQMTLNRQLKTALVTIDNTTTCQPQILRFNGASFYVSPSRVPGGSPWYHSHNGYETWHGTDQSQVGSYSQHLYRVDVYYSGCDTGVSAPYTTASVYVYDRFGDIWRSYSGDGNSTATPTFAMPGTITSLNPFVATYSISGFRWIYSYLTGNEPHSTAGANGYAYYQLTNTCPSTEYGSGPYWNNFISSHTLTVSETP